MTTVVVGAGVGGLSAAIALARRGRRVVLFEARSELGGLASCVRADGHVFDGGPYILLDRPGLTRAFENLGLDLESEIGELIRLDPVWTAEHAALDEPVVFHADLEQTASEFDRRWPGVGRRYERFVQRMNVHEARLRPMLDRAQPRPWHLLSSSAWLSVPLLLSNVGAVLRSAGLPEPLVDVLGVWTHVAGQDLNRAPSPLCFVPAIVHRVGAYVPRRGIRAVTDALGRTAAKLGVEIRLDERVRRIATSAGRVAAVHTEKGDVLETNHVVSNVGALSTYLKLLDVSPPRRLARFMDGLPMQSPGICAYLVARPRDNARPAHVRFRLPGKGELCRLLIDASACSEGAGDAEAELRLIAPMRHHEAQTMSPDQQRAFADRLVHEDWWRGAYEDIRLVELRTPSSWGQTFSLFANAMNPSMTAAFMRRGRFSHRAPHVRGLYLAGSSTHPGQWVSFCALSGCIAARELENDET